MVKLPVGATLVAQPDLRYPPKGGPTGVLFCLLLFTNTLWAQPLLVMDVEDGDTLLVEIDGTQERLQLAGIDAPEDSENAKLQRDVDHSGLAKAALLRLGQAATEHLRSLVVSGDQLKVIGQLGKRDRYGRITAQVSDRQGRSVGEQMVRDGYAVALRRHVADAALKARLTELETAAVAAHTGLWGNERNNAFAWSGRKP